MPKKIATMRISKPEVKMYNDLCQEMQAFNIARGLRPGTLTFYKQYYRTHRNYIIDLLKLDSKDFPISIYTDKLIISLIGKMIEKKLKPGAANTHLRFISTLTKFAASRGYLSTAPKVPKMKQDRQIGETYLPWELELILIKPELRKCDFVNYRNWVIVCFLLSTGCRLSSAINIRNKDVSLQKKTVLLSHTKNRQGQLLPLTGKLVSILQEYMETREGTPDSFLFCDYVGEGLTPHAVEQAVEQHNRSRGVTKHGVHSFRRTFATQAIKLGMSAFELQSLLGHSTIEMTSRYIKASELDLPASVTRFNPLEQYQTSREKSIFMKS